jgi:maltose alpha-D-glucosyltransferase/alpha-amylase
VHRYFERALTQKFVAEDQLSIRVNWEMLQQDIPAAAQELIGNYLNFARLLGQRTAEMHIALATPTDNPAFQAEPFTPHYQWSLYQSMRGTLAKTMTFLKERTLRFKEPEKTLALRAIDLQSKIQARLREIATTKLHAKLIRCHGDYHLGQVLYTGKDFVIIDFEGEPAIPISARRIKRSPLKDVAGMLRSFQYVPQTALSKRTAGPVARPEDREAVERWALFWQRWVSVAFLKTYFETVTPAQLLPNTPEGLQLLLHAYLIEKTLYELTYELNNRPDWVHIPLRGLLHIMEIEPAAILTTANTPAV